MSVLFKQLDSFSQRQKKIFIALSSYSEIKCKIHCAEFQKRAFIQDKHASTKMISFIKAVQV